MEGDAFEMEDQRNWADASFKTYVRPLSKPRPYVIAKGRKGSPADHGHDQGSGRGQASDERPQMPGWFGTCGRAHAVDGAVSRSG